MNLLNEILDLAIKNEQEAYQFYMQMAEKANVKEMRDVFIKFADEELKHKEKLITIKEAGYFTEQPENNYLLSLEEFITYEDLNPPLNLNYRQSLLMAIQKEKAAYKLYDTLSKYAANKYASAIFNSLAEEEAHHMERYQQEYDNFIVNNN